MVQASHRTAAILMSFNYDEDFWSARENKDETSNELTLKSFMWKSYNYVTSVIFGTPKE